MSRAVPAVRVLANGDLSVDLPRGAALLWNALMAALPLGSFREARAPTHLVVSKDELQITVMTLQHYFDEVDVLPPEEAEDPEPVFVEGHAFLDALPPHLIDRVYKSLAKALHPDAGGNTEAFVGLQKWAESRGRTR